MQISKREKEVLSLVCFSDKEIAQQLCLSTATINTYVISLFNKFVVNNRRQLLIKALKQKIINLDDVIIKDF